jgi:hypothetical protein
MGCCFDKEHRQQPPVWFVTQAISAEDVMSAQLDVGDYVIQRLAKEGALEGAGKGDTACYIEVVAGRTDYPAGLKRAHEHIDAIYANG